ncbi:MAG: hypothetical protein M1840_008134 [Geoglossum simile]|nr:MAG: hypothetical protein M1840_008134 [Geoglossum simile]
MGPFSVSELIQAVDTTVRVCESVRSATGEFQSLSRRLEFSSKILKEIQKTKRTDYEVSLLDEACNEYQTTLKELRSYLEKYKTLGDSDDGISMRERIKWMVNERYHRISKKYKSRITDHQNGITLLLQVNREHWPKDSSDPLLQDSQPDDKPGLPSQALNIEERSRQHLNRETRGSTDSCISFLPSIFSEAENCSPPETRKSSIVSTGADPQPALSLKFDISAETRRESYPQSLVSLDTVPLSGEVKLYANPSDSSITTWRLIIKFSWYRQGSGLEYIEVCRIVVERGNRGNTRGFLMETSSGKKIHHTLMGKDSQTPFTEHQRQFKDIRKFDSTVRHLVKFNGSQNVSKCNNVGVSRRVISSRAPEYSFTNEKDCIEFQNKVVGKFLLLCAEVDNIESHRCPLEGRWTTLQLWEGDGRRTIKFFSNKEIKPLEFNTAHLRVKSGKLERLNLEFRKDGKELERKLKFLEIRFTKPGDTDRANFQYTNTRIISLPSDRDITQGQGLAIKVLKHDSLEDGGLFEIRWWG